MIKLDKLDALLDKFVEMGVPSIDTSVWYKGKEIFRRMEGYSDAAHTKSICGRELYNIYSCSKPITVTAAMQLYEKGKYELDAPLSGYLPEFAAMTVREGGTVRPAERVITIEQLLTMTAGFSYDLWTENLKRARAETDGRCGTRDTMRYLAKDPLLFEPGEHYNYSLCHDVLAALVEVISGERFGEYVRANIFEPAGMEDSTFLPTPGHIERIAEQYTYDGNKRVYAPIGTQNGYRLGREYESGGAGCVSSVNDYIRFLEALRTGRLLKSETVELMSKRRFDERLQREFSLGEYGYSYGLGVRCPDGISERTDFGWGGAAGAYLACDIPRKYVVFHAQHVLGSPNQLMRNHIPRLICEALDG